MGAFIYILLSVFVSIEANSLGRSAGFWLFISLIGTPILGFILLFIVDFIFNR